jgi:hypothetical protein
MWKFVDCRSHIARLYKWITVILTLHNTQAKHCRKSVTSWLIRNTKNQDTYEYVIFFINRPFSVEFCGDVNWAYVFSSGSLYFIFLFVSRLFFVVFAASPLHPPTETKPSRTKVFHGRFLPYVALLTTIP